MKIIPKQLLLLFAMLASAVFVRAGNVEYLTFNVDGNPIVIALAEHPVITYTDNTLHVKTEKDTIDIPVKKLSGTAFTETTGIKGIDSPQLQMEAGSVCLMNLPSESKVIVYAADGTEKLSLTADSNGQAIVNVDNLPKGIYIVKSAKQSVKITNK